jgi:hypothetical protein
MESAIITLFNNPDRKGVMKCLISCRDFDRFCGELKILDPKEGELYFFKHVHGCWKIYGKT